MGSKTLESYLGRAMDFKKSAVSSRRRLMNDGFPFGTGIRPTANGQHAFA